MFQKLAWVFGGVFLIVGVLGFVPGAISHNLLLGIFEVDSLQNIIHLLSGLIAIGAAWGSGEYARLYFRAFGVVYAIIAVIGFLQGSSVLGIFAVNMADNLFHLIIAVAALWIGFGMKESVSARVDAASSAPSGI